MKSFTRFLLVALCLAPYAGANAVVATTAGNNLTAYNGAAAARDNNNWNNLMNNRTTPAVADFGNCNALILRCAQPKCASGGCTSMDVAQSIVAGCVQSNATCKQYGNDLVQYISAQLVASSTAKANEAANAASAAAAQAATAQSAQQLEQMQRDMQFQMQQMQSQMAAQNQETVAQLQSALEEQKRLTAQAIADASAATAAAATVDPNVPLAVDGLTTSQIAAASRGVSDDILAREQISGQILSKIENAEVALKALKASMLDTFAYAGCDTRGNDCSGPKRVSAFKRRALEFFDPYETILDELEDALIQAQAVGVDITDIYMMLSGSCNVWGQYLCNGSGSTGVYKDKDNCINGKSISFTGSSVAGATRGGHECVPGQTIPVEDSPLCTLLKTLTDAESDKVRREWLEPESGDDTMIRVGCASAALQTSAFFRGRRKQATLDIETLKNIIEQDAPQSYGSAWGTKRNPLQDGVKYCAVGANMFAELQKIVNLKSLPRTVCVPDSRLNQIQMQEDYLVQGDTDSLRIASITRKCSVWADLKGSNNKPYNSFNHCICDSADGTTWLNNTCSCDNNSKWDDKNFICPGTVTQGGGSTTGTQAASTGAANTSNNSCFATGGVSDLRNAGQCLCSGTSYNPSTQECKNNKVSFKGTSNTTLNNMTARFFNNIGL